MRRGPGHGGDRLADRGADDAHEAGMVGLITRKSIISAHNHALIRRRRSEKRLARTQKQTR